MKALKFNGSGAEYFKIWIVNILLTIITIGLYYPWAKVRNNRYFYANSELEGRSFDYHATGKQLFVGYLIAMGLLIAYIVIQSVSPTISLIVPALLFAAFPWIIWRSLKFNLGMTSFSNVRFGFDGKIGGAYINFMLLPILAFVAFYAPFIILGIAMLFLSGAAGVAIGLVAGIALLALAVFLFAFMKKKNTHYAINNYRYGQGQFLTEVETKPFLMILLKTIGLSLLLYTGFMIIVGLIAYLTIGFENIVSMQQSLQNPENIQGALDSGLGLIAAIYIGFILISFLIIAYSYSRQRKYILANSVLDEKITFASTLKALPFAWIMISNFIAVICSIGLALPWAKVRMARFFLGNTLVDTEVGFDSYISQKQQEQSSLGEQIGDAFDVDVGIGF